MAAPEMTKGAKTIDRTALRPRSFWSSSSARMRPRTIDPITAKKVKTTVLNRIFGVSARVAHST